MVGAGEAAREMDGRMAYFKAAVQLYGQLSEIFLTNYRAFVVHLEELEKLGKKEKL